VTELLVVTRPTPNRSSGIACCVISLGWRVRMGMTNSDSGATGNPPRR